MTAVAIKRPTVTLRWQARLDQYALHLAVLLTLGYILVISFAAVRKFQLYAMGYDLGLIQQAVWNTLHGRFLETHAYDFTNNLLGTDSFFVLLLFVPFYALFPNPATLLIVETVIVGSAAIPVYLLAQHILQQRWTAPVAVFLYLASLPVINGNLYEVRERTMAMAFVLWLLLCIYRGWYWRMLIPMVLALSCRLDTSIGVAIVGVYTLLARRGWRTGLTLIGAGALWYVTVTRVIIPAYTPQSGYMFLEHYADFGTTPMGIVLKVLTDPIYAVRYSLMPLKLWYLLGMFLPLAFLPLGDWRSLVAMLPLYGLNLLSRRQIQWDIQHHYQGLIVPFMLLGSLTTIAALHRRQLFGPLTMHWLLGMCVVLTLAAPFIFGDQLPGLLLPRAKPKIAQENQLVREIPPDVPVAVSNLLTPHLAPRRDLWLVPGDDFHYAAEPFKLAEYAALDLSNPGVTPAWDAAKADWCVVDRRGDLLVARRQAAANGATCQP